MCRWPDREVLDPDLSLSEEEDLEKEKVGAKFEAGKVGANI
jgi:hypothetical protein